MYYQTQILPIDDEGGFLLATHFAGSEVGGDDTRETACASFLLGNVDDLAKLKDVAPLFTMPRPASRERADEHRSAARGQDELARSGNYAKAMSEYYASNVHKFAHAAVLAEMDTVFVPRHVYASHAGRALLAFEGERTLGGLGRGTLRLVDLVRGVVVHEESSNRVPLEAKAGTFSTVQLSRPIALSQDGTRALLRQSPADRDERYVLDCRIEKGMRPDRKVSSPGFAQCAAGDGWLLLDDKNVRRVDASGKVIGEWATPPGANGFFAHATPDGNVVALVGTNGGLWILAAGSPPRRFDPHRGARRGSFAIPALSSCGQWLASRCDGALAVTRLADGVSWSAGRLEDQQRDEASHGGWTITNHIAGGVGFVKSRLLVADASGLREVALAPAPDVRAFVSERGRPGARVPIQVPASAPLEKMMKVAKLEAHAQEIGRHYSPAALLKTKALKKAGWLPATSPKAPPLGASRLGGWPDLPAEVAWPVWEGRPMSFLAQVNLAEAHSAQSGLRLPKEGLLSFFLACSDQVFEPKEFAKSAYLSDIMVGTDAGDRGAWRVIHTRSATDLVRKVFEGSVLPHPYQPCSIKFSRGGAPLPDEQTIVYERLRFDDDARENYNELVGQLAPEEEPRVLDQLMGFPRLIQSTPPEMMCELSTRGLNPWKFPQKDDPAYEGLSAAAAEWGLLLQLTSNPDADYLWGDGGHFYFYGHRAAMEKGDFSSVWVNYEN